MAIAFDANLGSGDTSGSTTLNITTTAAAAANARIVTLNSWFSLTAGSSISAQTIAGTSTVQDKKTTNGSDFFEIRSVHKATSTTSASALNSTLSSTAGNNGGWLIGAMSFTGVASTAAVVTTSNSNSTGASWSSGAATNTGQANAVFVGGAGYEDPTAATSSTATSGTEVHDRYRTADQQGIVSGYKIVSTVASDAITGTLSNVNSTANTGALVIYADAAGAGTTPSLMPPRRFPRALAIR